MNRKSLSTLAAVILALPLSLLSACGAPSALDLCYMGCDYNKKCLSSSDVDLTNCRNNCNDKKGSSPEARRIPASSSTSSKVGSPTT